MYWFGLTCILQQVSQRNPMTVKALLQVLLSLSRQCQRTEGLFSDVEQWIHYPAGMILQFVVHWKHAVCTYKSHLSDSQMNLSDSQMNFNDSGSFCLWITSCVNWTTNVTSRWFLDKFQWHCLLSAVQSTNLSMNSLQTAVLVNSIHFCPPLTYQLVAALNVILRAAMSW